MNPVISFLRSVILVEQYRTLLMNLFRIPLNLVVITTLILVNYFNPFIICLIVAFIIFFALVASLYLIIYYYKNLQPDPSIESLFENKDALSVKDK